MLPLFACVVFCFYEVLHGWWVHIWKFTRLVGRWYMDLYGCFGCGICIDFAAVAPRVSYFSFRLSCIKLAIVWGFGSTSDLLMDTSEFKVLLMICGVLLWYVSVGLWWVSLSVAVLCCIGSFKLEMWVFEFATTSVECLCTLVTAFCSADYSEYGVVCFGGMNGGLLTVVLCVSVVFAPIMFVLLMDVGVVVVLGLCTLLDVKFVISLTLQVYKFVICRMVGLKLVCFALGLFTVYEVVTDGALLRAVWSVYNYFGSMGYCLERDVNTVILWMGSVYVCDILSMWIVCGLIYAMMGKCRISTMLDNFSGWLGAMLSLIEIIVAVSCMVDAVLFVQFWRLADWWVFAEFLLTCACLFVMDGFLLLLIFDVIVSDNGLMVNECTMFLLMLTGINYAILVVNVTTVLWFEFEVCLVVVAVLVLYFVDEYINLMLFIMMFDLVVLCVFYMNYFTLIACLWELLELFPGIWCVDEVRTGVNEYYVVQVCHTELMSRKVGCHYCRLTGYGCDLWAALRHDCECAARYSNFEANMFDWVIGVYVLDYVFDIWRIVWLVGSLVRLWLCTFYGQSVTFISACLIGSFFRALLELNDAGCLLMLCGCMLYEHVCCYFIILRIWSYGNDFVVLYIWVSNCVLWRFVCVCDIVFNSFIIVTGQTHDFGFYFWIFGCVYGMQVRTLPLVCCIMNIALQVLAAMWQLPQVFVIIYILCLNVTCRGWLCSCLMWLLNECLLYGFLGFIVKRLWVY
eukprot:gene13048-8894_t